MPRRRRTKLALEADRRNREQLAKLGGTVKAARARRRLTQHALGGKVGLSRAAISRAERGLGGTLTLDAWQRIGLALAMPLVVSLARDATEEPADAGHLALQELVLRYGRATGRKGAVELPTRPAEPARSIDVALADDRAGIVIVCECWNSIGDIGAAVRTSTRKVAEADALAALRWGEASGGARLAWIVRATTRNRALVARYPEVFATAFPGSSAAWVRALRDGAEPPREPGLVWASIDGTRIWHWRRRTEKEAAD